MPAKVGQAIVYTDCGGEEHDALVMAVWTETLVNLVFVEKGLANAADEYGEVRKYRTSVSHRSAVGEAKGNFWREREADVANILRLKSVCGLIDEIEALGTRLKREIETLWVKTRAHAADHGLAAQDRATHEVEQGAGV